MDIRIDRSPFASIRIAIGSARGQARDSSAKP